jgi:hypothetical protein
MLFLGGCGNATGPDDDVRAARARWQRTHPANYAYTLRRSCECIPETTSPARIVVHGDVVQSRTYVGSGEPVDPRWAEFFPTVDALLVTFEDAAKRAASFDAEYDAHYGYPHRVSIDYSRPAVDDEIGLYITDFTPLP